MEKVFGATERHDQLLVFGTRRAVLIYGYGEEDGQGFDYRHIFDHKPTKEEVQDILIAHINACTDERIVSGFRWEVLHGKSAGVTANVWLSQENQANYKAFHDGVVYYPQVVTLPVTFKIGETADGSPVYEVFQSKEELSTFYLKILAYIQKCLEAGWAEKDGIDMTVFGYE